MSVLRIKTGKGKVSRVSREAQGNGSGQAERLFMELASK